MKAKSLIVMLASAFALASVAQAEDGAVNGGSVHFKGEVVNAACAVDWESADQIVQMGQVRSVKLASAGETSSAKGFNIQLNDCDTTVSTKASVAFLGTTVSPTETTVLALQSSAAGSATNVGIQIMDNTGTPLKLDGADFSTAVQLNDGTNVLPFQARYYATDAATAGTANADATFSIKYE